MGFVLLALLRKQKQFYTFMKDLDYVSKAWPMNVLYFQNLMIMVPGSCLGTRRLTMSQSVGFFWHCFCSRGLFSQVSVVPIDLENGACVAEHLRAPPCGESLEWLECTLLERIAWVVSWDSA